MASETDFNPAQVTENNLVETLTYWANNAFEEPAESMKHALCRRYMARTAPFVARSTGLIFFKATKLAKLAHDYLDTDNSKPPALHNLRIAALTNFSHTTITFMTFANAQELCSWHAMMMIFDPERTAVQKALQFTLFTVAAAQNDPHIAEGKTVVEEMTHHMKSFLAQQIREAWAELGKKKVA